MRGLGSFASFACLAGLLGLAAPAAADAAAPDAASPSPRSASGDTPRREIEVLLVGGYGAGGSVDDNPINRYGAGFGARAGVTLRAPRLYFGGSLIRFLGNEGDTGKYFTTTLDAHAGYDFRLIGALLLIRPELAFGVAQTAAIQSDNAGYPLTPHLAPGLLAGVRLPPLLAFAQVRGDFMPGTDEWSDAVTALFGAGAIF
jgi:hypothetical protein